MQYHTLTFVIITGQRSSDTEPSSAILITKPEYPPSALILMAEEDFVLIGYESSKNTNKLYVRNKLQVDAILLWSCLSFT